MVAPLEGIRILDWTQWQMGTVATAMLGDLGAEVIHIEDRERGDPGRGLTTARGISLTLASGKNAYFEYNNHGKKGIAIDLKRQEGTEIVYRLVKNADVFVHNFRQGVPERLSLGYDILSQYNPQLIYAALSGYGPKGPESHEPAFDYLGLARSGMMTIAGEPNSPPASFAGGIADQMGAIMAAYGILAALTARERLGIGQQIDISHLGSMTTLQGLGTALRLSTGKDLPREYRHKVANPLWNHYLCADGKWIALGMLQPDRQWPNLCKALVVEHLENDDRFDSAENRRKNSEELIGIIDSIFVTKTSNEWMGILKAAGDIVCTPVQTISDLVDDPQVLANEYIVEANHKAFGPIRSVGVPIQFSKTPGKVNPAAPEFGEHTEEVLIGIGDYTWEEIGELKEKEVI
ncbi:MAG: CoA transferase [Chloroflexota bacterium]|nr:CoA transferase [Chloroflexota bacterium]